MRTMPLLHDTDFQAAIVDLDGTMVDTIGDFEVALSAALADLGWPPVGRAFIARTVGKGIRAPDREHAGRGRRAGGALRKPPGRATSSITWLINGQHATVFPGVVEGLRALTARGWRLACLTNKPGAFARPLLERKGLAGFFDQVFGGDDFACKKPDPLPLLQTCAALGSAPARTLMVGDSSNDALAARAAGCPVVLLSYGYNHGKPAAAAGADAVIDRLDELAPLLDRPEGP